jgi:two-component system NtrC family sensor kinase
MEHGRGIRHRQKGSHVNDSVTAQKLTSAQRWRTTMKILVADDDPVFQMLLTQMLTEWGYDVLVATDGNEAWKQVRSQGGPRLAIVDWVMPGLDGLEVCRRVRAERKNDYVYILLMTAKNKSSDLLTVMEAGADDYVTKPFDPEELRLRLRAGCRVLESEERYRVIAQTASDGIVTADETGRIQFANDAAAAIFGFSDSELLWRDFESLAPGYLECFARCEGNANSPEAPIELVGKHKTGREMPLEISLSKCVQGPQNHRLTLVIRDVTERKRTERQLAQSQRLESIGQLAAGIAHEINTPIQYVSDNIHFLSDSFKGLSALLAAYRECECLIQNEVGVPSWWDRTMRLAEEIDVDYLQAEIPKAIQQSLEGAKRVAEIVGAMKELSHPGTTAQCAVDLNHLISNTILVSKHAWKLIAEVTTDFDLNLPAIQCIAGDLSQVILNLIVNAADAIGDAIKGKSGIKGHIQISTRRCGNWAEIRVSDTGTGIPESIQPRIFDPFFTTKDVGKGTGQGLAIAHAIITQKHQGTIQLDTQKGLGTTFVICLPIEGIESGPVASPADRRKQTMVTHERTTSIA